LPLAKQARLRRPVAAAFLDNGRMLCIANQRSGTLSLLDLRPGSVVEEVAVGERPAGLAVLPDRRHMLVVDEARHQLLAVLVDQDRLRIQARLPVDRYPVSVAVLDGGRRAAVACLWSHRIDIIDLTSLASDKGNIPLRVERVICLPFAPREQVALPGTSEVVAADAFGGRVALVDAARGELVAVREWKAHNCRGMAISADGKELLAAHQVLDQETAATRAHIERGVLMKNVLRTLPLDTLKKPDVDLEAMSSFTQLGVVGRGAGDPAGIANLGGNQVAVALAGVNELAIVPGNGDVRRIPVGRRPTALAAEESGHTCVTVNSLDDSITVVSTDQGVVTRTITLGPQPALGPADRGERLFFDAQLGRDGWLSCNSCHTDGHTNGLLADTLADHTYGTPKRTLTLMNTALTDPWAWNGEVKYLHDQVQQSFMQTMHADKVTAEQVNDLVAFLHTLPPPPPLQPATNDTSDREQLEHGRQLFRQRGCVNCHIPPLTYSSHGTHDVGFADERGLRMFNPPSLRGVSQGYRFLHDNRAASLEEVFTKYRHKVGPGLSRQEMGDLLRFLRSL
jgi:cytochrome c peroxidase